MWSRAFLLVNIISMSWVVCIGHIPTTMGQMTRLTQVDMGINSLEGTIPTELGSLKFVTQLDMSYNSFTGAVPSSFARNETSPGLRLSVQGNRLTGIDSSMSTVLDNCQC